MALPSSSDITFTADQSANIDMQAATLATNQGLSSVSKASGSIYFNVSNAAMAFPQAQFDALFKVEVPVPVPVPVPVEARASAQINLPGGVGAAVAASSDPEEARLLKHMSKKPPASFKPVGIGLNNPPLQMKTHDPVVSSSPARKSIVTTPVPSTPTNAPSVNTAATASPAASTSPSSATPAPSSGGSNGRNADEDVEAARLAKHLTKASNPGMKSPRSGGGGGAGTANVTATAGGGAASGTVNVGTTPNFKLSTGPRSAALDSPVPAWKVKQLEREQEEKQKREQEKAKVQANQQAALAESIAEANADSTAQSSAQSSAPPSSTSVSVSDTVYSTENEKPSVAFGADEDEKMKKEEERLMKLMSGGGTSNQRLKTGGMKF